ncbi:hypothetical protein, partial [Leptospira wolffii]|uniref:hypothetical protein n=1 Tax=Leptospira wolffii TaxID=409998 RepID=UPI001A9C47C5
FEAELRLTFASAAALRAASHSRSGLRHILLLSLRLQGKLVPTQNVSKARSLCEQLCTIFFSSFAGFHARF